MVGEEKQSAKAQSGDLLSEPSNYSLSGYELNKNGGVHMEPVGIPAVEVTVCNSIRRFAVGPNALSWL